DILDLLPTELWSNPNAKFLDPVSKSGVFLREMAKRLMKGLETQIPDKQERINHIFSQQLYGIAITDLTALLSRRSVYCSKTANGKYSICETFTDEQGNIRYKRMKHTWQNGKCTYCGASQEVYDREDALETYAYNFIHTDNPEKLFNMKFDVIVGNPPYQLNDGGGAGTSAVPIYHKFIQQAKKLNPRFISMIVPARWYSGGKGLDEFRDEMLNDNRIREIHDYLDASDCFPGVQIKGGVCYFLWNRDNPGLCKVTSYNKSQIVSISERPLLENGAEVFIRFNEAISILKKVRKFNEASIINEVSSRKPYGIDSNFKNFKKEKSKEFNIKLYRFGDVGYISKSQVLKGEEYINQLKVIISKAGSGSDSFPHQILGVPIISEPNSVSSETYIILRTFDNENQAKNFISYVSTKFFRLLVALIKNTQNAAKGVYYFVPIQDFNEPWTDEKLYKKYGLTEDEIAFIESMIRPMDLSQNGGEDE
ncbi:MAG: Eco57I restriction-modification methylase domain-containing protein, partial [Flavobacterium sp.]|nr:Eco57I restriction-modification methylase domain-containing protein [Flavobacterium sp.]